MKTVRELKTHLEGMTHNFRYTLSDVNESVSEFLGFKVEFQDIEPIGLDYRIGVSLSLIDNKIAYVDIYYLKDRNNNMLITDIGFDSDNVLNSRDYDKKIKGGY